MSTFQIESFTTGSRQPVHANDLMTALEITAGDNFTVAQVPDGRFVAVSNENSMFNAHYQYWAHTPEAAAESIRSRYHAIQTAKA